MVTKPDRRAEIVRTALGLLDDQGADAVSLRAVADRVGVRLNTISWHVKTKARLLELMADAILADLSTADLPRGWCPRLPELTRRYRAALLAHRDGARIVAGTYAAGEHTLRAAEAFVACLLDAGLTERDAAWVYWSIVYFTLGLTQEEQDAPGAVGPTLQDTVTASTYPALSRTLPHLDIGSFHERFEFGLDLIVGSLQSRISSSQG